MRHISGLSFEKYWKCKITEQKEIICYKYLIRTSIHPVLCWGEKADGLVSMKILIKSKIVQMWIEESMSEIFACFTA